MKDFTRPLTAPSPSGGGRTGTGMDVGGGLDFSHSVTGLPLDARMRTLVVHRPRGSPNGTCRSRSAGTRRRRARWGSPLGWPRRGAGRRTRWPAPAARSTPRWATGCRRAASSEPRTPAAGGNDRRLILRADEVQRHEEQRPTMVRRRPGRRVAIPRMDRVDPTDACGSVAFRPARDARNDGGGVPAVARHDVSVSQHPNLGDTRQGSVSAFAPYAFRTAILTIMISLATAVATGC